MKKCNHNYCAGCCIHCGQDQPVIKPKRTVVKKKKKITSELQYKTDKLITYLGVPVKEFPRFARYVKKLDNVDKIIGEIKEIDDWLFKEKGKHLKKVGYFINHWIKPFKRK